MKTIIIGVVATTAVLFTSGCLCLPLCARMMKSSKSDDKQTVCPVTGEKINEEIFVDHADGRIYFCSEDCPEKFEEDPETYLEKMQ